MCYLLVEQFAACGCVYHKHEVDRCASYNQSGHKVQVKVIPVGYTCNDHAQLAHSETYTYSDSGYQSGHSHKSSKNQYR